MKLCISFLVLTGFVPDTETNIVVVRSNAELGQALVKSEDGTVIKIMNGQYDQITISTESIRVGDVAYGKSPPGDEQIHITAEDPESRPEIGSIEIKGGACWTFSDLIVRPRAGQVGITIAHDNVEIRNCVIDNGDSSRWSIEDWIRNAGDGIAVRSGERVQLVNNRLNSVADGINVFPPAKHVTVRGNTVENFCMDGIRALADHGLYEKNLVKNAHVIDDNHADMLQSWSTGKGGKPGKGVIRDVVIRGNTFIAHSDPKQPFLRRGRSGVQGIGMFNGVFKDFVIENNIVVCDHFHGITVYGADNVRIENNTVVDFDSQFPGPPWISVKGAISDCSIRGNIRMKVGASDERVKQQGNIEIRHSDYSMWFRNAKAGDFRLVDAPPRAAVGAR